MAINLPQAYSTILDQAFTLKSVTGPAFKGKFEVVGGTTNVFKVYSVTSQAMRDYTTQKNPGAPGGVGTWGFQYQQAANVEQTITATQDKYFAIPIDKADAKFSKDGSLDASEWMRAQMEEQILPMIDKYNISKLIAAGTVTGATVASTTSTAYSRFQGLMVAATNALVPTTGRVVLATASWYALLKQDPTFTPASELTAESRRSGNYGRIDDTLVIEVPDSYMSDPKIDAILTHESAAAAPRYLADYNQGEFKEAASGYFVNGRVVHEAFVFGKKATAVRLLKNAP